MKFDNVKIIGLGGIGSILSDKLCRFISYSLDSNITITFIDGDTYEVKNKQRQDFVFMANKATSKKNEISSKLNINPESVEEYINSSNVSQIIKDGDLVFLCVDNHTTRKLVSDYAKTLNNIIIISGGNDFIDGNVQVFCRHDGNYVTPSLTDYHPEIDNPKDKHPDDMSCAELMESAPQLYFTNLTVATIMCWCFYALVNDKFNFFKSEIYFDINTMSVLSKTRIIKD